MVIDTSRAAAIFVSLAISLLVFIMVIVFIPDPESYPVNIRGTFTGLLPAERGSELVRYDPISERFRQIVLLTGVTPNNYGVTTGNGKSLSYTKWDDTATKRYLIVRNMTSGKEKEFLKESDRRFELVAGSKVFIQFLKLPA